MPGKTQTMQWQWFFPRMQGWGGTLNHFPLFFSFFFFLFFFEVEVSSLTPILLFMSESVHSGSAS